MVSHRNVPGPFGVSNKTLDVMLLREHSSESDRISNSQTDIINNTLVGGPIGPFRMANYWWRKRSADTLKIFALLPKVRKMCVHGNREFPKIRDDLEK